MSLGMIPTCFLESEVVAEPDEQLEALEVLREAHVDGLVAVQRLLVVAGAPVARGNHQLPLHLKRRGLDAGYVSLVKVSTLCYFACGREYEVI